MALKLYTYPNNKNAFKALIAAEINKVKIELPQFEFGVTNKTDKFVKLNPFAKVPTLETPEGGIFESNSIARYVARLADHGLCGSTPVEAGQIDSWIDFSSNEVDAPLLSWVYPLLNIWPYDKKKEDAAKESLNRTFATLDKVFQERTFLVGHSVTLADICMACNLLNGFKMVFDPEFLKPFPSLVRYFNTMIHQPAFAKVIGKVEMCTQCMQYNPNAAKKEEPKKEEKPAKKPAKEEDDDDLEEPKEEKKKDPLMDLPKSKMILDSWKRLYSNTPAKQFKEVCCGGLWNGADIPNSPNNEHFEGFDTEGYSIWFIEHKYPEENTVNYKAMNAVSGFFQRIDYARKHTFGVVSILRDPAKGCFPIKGFFIFRGQEINWQIIEECPDVELYNWTKADPNDAKTRERVEMFMMEPDTVDGFENVEVKKFK